MEEKDNKVKRFVKNNFLYFIIVFACIAYVAYGLVKIETSGKTILEIIGQGIIIFLVGYTISYLFSLQGLLSGDKKDEVIKTNKLHSKCVADIDPKINEMDDWCEEENTKTYVKIRKQILNKEGLRYSDCFDSEGTALDIDFPLKEMEFEVKTKEGDKEIVETYTAEEMKSLYPTRYKIEKKKIKLYNKRQNAKRKAFQKAMRVKITLLSTDAITATTIKNDDPHNLGTDRRTYQKREARSDLISRAIMGIVFAYFSFSFVFGWAYIISSLVQIAIFLLFGGIKWVQSYYFVTEDLRKRTVRQINYLQRFKCDKGIATKEEVEEENKQLKGDKQDVNLEQIKEQN